MTGVILAAGAGSRLGELGKRYSKPMLPLCGRPMIDWVIDALQRAGLQRFVAVAHPSDEALASHFQRRAALPGGLHCEVVLQPERRGIADALRLALPLLAGEDGYLACACDSLFTDAELHDLVAAARAHADQPTIAVLEMDVEATRSRSAVLLRGDDVIALVEKPAPGTSHSPFVALPLYWLPRDFGRLLQPAANSETYVTTALQEHLNAGGQVHAVRFRTRIEVTRPEDVASAEAWLEAHAVLPGKPT